MAWFVNGTTQKTCIKQIQTNVCRTPTIWDQRVQHCYWSWHVLICAPSDLVCGCKLIKCKRPRHKNLCTIQFVAENCYTRNVMFVLPPILPSAKDPWAYTRGLYSVYLPSSACCCVLIHVSGLVCEDAPLKEFIWTFLKILH